MMFSYMGICFFILGIIGLLIYMRWTKSLVP
jgi:preprotein translocase subunit Sss1